MYEILQISKNVHTKKKEKFIQINLPMIKDFYKHIWILKQNLSLV